MSVAPDDPRHLPPHRRPVEFDGTGRDPLWRIRVQDLSADLRAVSDPRNPNHWLVAPGRAMTIDDLRAAVEETRDFWELIDKGSLNGTE